MTRRDWSDAESKREDGCRVGYYCGYDECAGPIELAHTVGRRYDTHRVTGGDMDGRSHPTLIWVDPSAVVPLCTLHHQMYDARILSIVEFLTLEEQGFAANRLGLVRALRRVSPTQNQRVEDGA